MKCNESLMKNRAGTLSKQFHIYNSPFVKSNANQDLLPYGVNVGTCTKHVLEIYRFILNTLNQQIYFEMSGIV